MSTSQPGKPRTWNAHLHGSILCSATNCEPADELVPVVEQAALDDCQRQANERLLWAIEEANGLRKQFIEESKKLAAETARADRNEAVIEAAKAWNQHREYLKGRYVTGDQISEADFDEADRLIQLLAITLAALLAAEAEREK